MDFDFNNIASKPKLLIMRTRNPRGNKYKYLFYSASNATECTVMPADDKNDPAPVEIQDSGDERKFEPVIQNRQRVRKRFIILSTLNLDNIEQFSPIRAKCNLPILQVSLWHRRKPL